MTVRFLAALLLTAAALALPASPAAAQRDCEFLPGSGDLQSVTIGDGSRITYVSRPRLSCRDGVRIQADSAVMYEGAGFTQLFGSVYFEDATQALRSRTAQYLSREGLLRAQGAVELTDRETGSMVWGELLDYQRPTAARDEHMTVTGGRPRGRFVVERTAPPPGDSAAAPPGAPPDSMAATPPDTAAPRVATATPPVAAPRPRPDTAAPDTVTYELNAERIEVARGRHLVATGQAEIEREGMQAFGDSVDFDQDGGALVLVRGARVLGEGYELTAHHIVVDLPGEEVREVDARRDAVLLGEDLRLDAPRILLFLEAQRMERLVALQDAGEEGDSAAVATEAATGEAGEELARVPGEGPPRPARPGEGDAVDGSGPADSLPARPVAVAQDVRLTADSLEVLAPGEVLDRIFAAGDGLGESTSRDSLNTQETPLVARRDWISGDTIIATFTRVERPPGTAVPAPPAAPTPGEGATPDSARSEYRVERLTARGNARSLYRLVPSDTAGPPTPGRLAIHYVTGDEIVIDLNAGEVEHMEVTGQTSGIHLEPRRLPAIPADSVRPSGGDETGRPPAGSAGGDGPPTVRERGRSR